MPGKLNSQMPYDQLLVVDEPHLVERYYKALKSFGLKPPSLKKFSIDMTGFSPEVAKSLKDVNYLDPNSVNRRFVILSPEQALLPVTHTSFSNTQDLMSEFFEKNRRVLNALTIKDVVFGEIEDSVFEVDDIDDLLAIEQVEFRISTHEKLTAKTSDLKMKIDRLLKEPDAWRDDEMLHEMVELARQTGDIRDNELVPEEVLFRHETYWASHFGGIYVFNDEQQITVICDPSAKGFRKSRPWQVSYLDINDTRNVFRFLVNSGRLDAPKGSWIERSGLIDLRIKMAAGWLAAANGEKLPSSIANRSWFDQWIRDNRPLINKDGLIPVLLHAVQQVDEWNTIDIAEVDDDIRFALSRANPEHDDMALVNRLVSEYLPFDFVTRFEFNRPNFDRDQKEWSKDYSGFVANVLNRYYLEDRERIYDKLYV